MIRSRIETQCSIEIRGDDRGSRCTDRGWRCGDRGSRSHGRGSIEDRRGGAVNGDGVAEVEDRGSMCSGDQR